MPANISWNKMVKKFRNLGFCEPYSGGRHCIMAKGELKVHIPNNHGKDISIGLIYRILRQVKIDKKEWDNA